MEYIFPGHLVIKINNYRIEKENADRKITLNFTQLGDGFVDSIELDIKLPSGITICCKSETHNSIIHLIIRSNDIECCFPSDKTSDYKSRLLFKRELILSYIKKNDKFHLQWRCGYISYNKGKLEIYFDNTFIENIECTKNVFIDAVNNYNITI